MVIEFAINTQNCGVIEVFEPNDLKLRTIVSGPKCPTRKLSQLIDILLKRFCKRIKSRICDSFGFLNKCPRSYRLFFTKYQEDLHTRFRKEFLLESENFVLKNNTLTFDSVSKRQRQQCVQCSHLPTQIYLWES